jgi:hypothetical protein
VADTAGVQGTAEPGSQPDQPVGMIASGSATAPVKAEATDIVRPQPAEGVQRVVTLDEARKAVPFTLMEPATLPENTYLTIAQLIQDVEGGTSPRLPAVRLIYDVEGVGVIVLMQSPATGEPGEGEDVPIGNVTGNILENPDATVLTWEDNGVRYEMRGGQGVPREALLAAAASLAPSQGEGAAGPTSAGGAETAGETEGQGEGQAAASPSVEATKAP